MPPRRASKSPAPAAKKSTPASSSSRAAKSPAKAKPTTPARSPASKKSAVVSKSEPSEPKPAGTPAATKVAEAAATTTRATTKAGTGSSGNGFVVAGMVALLCVLVGGAALVPLSNPQKSVPTLSAKAFKGTELKDGADRYLGSALILFTVNVTTDNTCSECNSLDELTKSVPFKQQLYSWWSAGTLRIGKVYCNQQQELCGRFPGDARPMALWFQAGKEMGAYEGELSLDGLQAWVKKTLS